MTLLARRTAIAVFLAFAIAYFFSALLRAITATLSPVLTREFALNARDLGLLAGGYFFEPTVLTDVDSGMRVGHEETFGPMAPRACR